jgi:hypothetical protein
MTKFNVPSVLAGAATAVALLIVASGNAMAHGGGIGGHGYIGHGPTTLTKTTKWTNFRDHDRRRFFRFREFGYVGVAAVPYCFYKWTPLGRVRVCPDAY